MLVRGENLPMNYPWGNLGGQVENVCPLGAEKGQSLPISALRIHKFPQGLVTVLLYVQIKVANLCGTCMQKQTNSAPSVPPTLKFCS